MKPIYAFRLWRVDAESGVLVSLTAQDSAWTTRLLTARCNEASHPAPQADCTCGIYGLQDLLDVQRQIHGHQGEYPELQLGVIAGYGGAHNDGEVPVHDACIRFAEAEIVALAKIGQPYRTGLTETIADKLGVPMLSLSEMQGLVDSGRILARKEMASQALYLDKLEEGASGSVAGSALLMDWQGRLYLRNDREVWSKVLRYDDRRITVSVRKNGVFHVDTSHTSEIVLNPLPFDGPTELLRPDSFLAGPVSSMNHMISPSDSARYRKGWREKAVSFPSSVLQYNVDMLRPGQRLQFNDNGEAGVLAASDGRTWVTPYVDGRGKWERANYTLICLDEGRFALDLRPLRGGYGSYDSINGPYKPLHVPMNRRVAIDQLLDGGKPLGNRVPKFWLQNCGWNVVPDPDTLRSHSTGPDVS